MYTNIVTREKLSIGLQCEEKCCRLNKKRKKSEKMSSKILLINRWINNKIKFNLLYLQEFMHFSNLNGVNIFYLVRL